MKNSETDKRRNGVKPPWISKADLDAFLERSHKLSAPKHLDSAWVSSYKLAAAHPDSVVGLLKWLGVVAADNSVDAGKWNSLRVPASRQSSLKALVEESFAAIFDALDVLTATSQDLAGAFIEEYSVGDTARQVRAFVALCEHAAIRAPRSMKSDASAPPRPRHVAGATAVKARHPAGVQNSKSRDGRYSIAVNVEIPADWDENRIRDRLAAVKSMLESVEADG